MHWVLHGTLLASSPHLLSSPKQFTSSARVGREGGTEKTAEHGEHVSCLGERRAGIGCSRHIHEGRTRVPGGGEFVAKMERDLDARVSPCALAFAFANSVWDLACGLRRF